MVRDDERVVVALGGLQITQVGVTARRRRVGRWSDVLAPIQEDIFDDPAGAEDSEI